jgi:hypothetical protein
MPSIVSTPESAGSLILNSPLKHLSTDSIAEWHLVKPSQDSHIEVVSKLMTHRWDGASPGIAPVPTNYCRDPDWEFGARH